MSFLILFAALFVAYANGANDNFKGVATLYGGRVQNYRNTLGLATLATLAGSLASSFLGVRLLRLFSAKGIIVDSVVIEPAFLLCVGLATAITVILATFLGMPLSTTHSLLGGLLGAGIASGGLTSFLVLGKSFFLPLLLGPLAALAITVPIYAVLHAIRRHWGIESTHCLCIGNRQEVLAGAPGWFTIRATGVRVTVEQDQYCRSIYSGTLAGINIQRLMDGLHYLSAGAVSFARGLNDTPKIAAIALSVAILSPQQSVLCIALAMMMGGLLHSRRIAQRMSFDITEMNPGQAFAANIVTSGLVIGASLMGLPLSTTHVSCGSIFGIGTVARKARVQTIVHVCAAWVVTLPLAMTLSALLWFLFT